MHLKAKRNEYASALGPLLDKTPKAVFAAVAVSLLTSGGDHWELLGKRFIDEWHTLYVNGVVPQRPPGHREKS